MILTDSLLQTIALCAFGGLGIAAGLIFWALWQFERAFATRLLFNVVAESCFCALFFGAFCVIELCVFDFGVKYYHLTTALITAALIYGFIRWCLRNRQDAMQTKAAKIKQKCKENRLIRRLFR